jgi:hypothetical protein
MHVRPFEKASLTAHIGKLQDRAVMLQYRVLEPERLIILRVTGTVGVENLRRLFGTILSEHPEAARFDVLWDARELSNIPTRDEVEQVAQITAAMGLDAHPRCSVMLVGRLAHYGMARMFELVTERETRVSRRTTMSLKGAAGLLQRTEASLRSELESDDWRTSA